jgi:hypothetical protein
LLINEPSPYSRSRVSGTSPGVGKPEQAANPQIDTTSMNRVTGDTAFNTDISFVLSAMGHNKSLYQVFKHWAKLTFSKRDYLKIAHKSP